MLASINSQADVELGHKLSEAEVSELSTNFSLRIVLDAINKVKLSNHSS